jgi:hypothetical protein
MYGTSRCIVKLRESKIVEFYVLLILLPSYVLLTVLSSYVLLTVLPSCVLLTVLPSLCSVDLAAIFMFC